MSHFPVRTPAPPPPPLAPPAPADPPTVADVARSARYSLDILNSSVSTHPARPTIDDVGDSVVQSLAVAQRYGGNAAAPPWFNQAMNQALAPINARLAAVENSVRVMEQRLVQVARNAQRAYNSSMGDGMFVPFQEVFFANGDVPSAHPHNLPAITNAVDIKNLYANDLRAYCVGHNVAVPNDVAVQQELVATLVGATTFRATRRRR